MRGPFRSVFLAFLLPLIMTMVTNSHCTFNTSSRNFTLAKENVIVDIEKFVRRIIPSEQNELDEIRMHFQIFTLLIRIKSSFDSFYVPSNSDYYKYRNRKGVFQSTVGGLSFLQDLQKGIGFNRYEEMSAGMFSFGYDNLEEHTSNSTTFEAINQIANDAVLFTRVTFLFNPYGKTGASIPGILGVLQDVKSRIRSEENMHEQVHKQLGLFTSSGDTSDPSPSICNATPYNRPNVGKILELVNYVFLGPFQCTDGETPEGCFNKTRTSFEMCVGSLVTITISSEKPKLGMVATTSSFGRDYWSRAELWCRLSQYAEENGHHVIMLDEDGFIRDYVDDSLVWDNEIELPQQRKKIVAYTIVTTVCTMLVILLLLVIRIQYNRRNKLNFLSKEEIDEFFKGTGGADIGWNVGPYNIELEIPKDDILIDSDAVLGSGTFGTVYQGRISGSAEAVAIKMTKKYSECASTLRGFLSEIKVLSYLGDHEHIIGLRGTCTAELEKGGVYVVLELCPKGSLEKYLRAIQSPEKPEYTVLDTEHGPNGDDTCVSHRELMRFCHEICLGVEFLASKNVVHGDIATRNVLLTSRLQVKIADFGLSRRLYEYTKYVKEQQEPLPWKWMAPEALLRSELSEKSDIWAFGVTMWEIFSLGNVPYPGLSWQASFAQDLEQGLRLEVPDICPQNVYDVMQQCWHTGPENRPTFSELQPLLAPPPT